MNIFILVMRLRNAVNLMYEYNIVKDEGIN